MFASEPSTSAGVSVIPAEPDHAEGIARVSIDTWRLVYPGLVPDTVLSGLNYARLEARHRQWIGRPQTEHWVAVDDLTGEVVAYANGGASRSVGRGPAGEVYELYVQNGYQGQGLGRQLFAAVRGALARQGLTSVMVWVLSTNPNRAFYEHLGGRFVGGKSVRVGDAALHEVGYRWD